MFESKIVWENWKNPMLPDFEVQIDDEPDEEYVETRKEIARSKAFTGQFMAGPMGVIPLTNSGNPERIFKLFVGHTNFNVSEPFMEAIKVLPGVEILKVMSRYRIWLGVGQLFEANAVKASISGLLKKPQASNKSNTLADMANRKFKHWSTGKMSNGKAELITANSEEELLNKVRSAAGFVEESSSARKK